MKEKVASLIVTLATMARLYKRQMLVSFVITAAVPLVILAIAVLVVQPQKKHVLTAAKPADIVAKDVRVGLVLGAGITKDGKPYRELQSRLDAAAEAVRLGYVDKLLLSGDNRFAHYDEPTAMKRYLMNEHDIPASKLQEDFAGRSTYESCERAAKVFDVDKTIIFSAGSHLPRAIYLCRHFGVESYGLASAAEANNATRREAIARVKALLNVYVNGENTILGAHITL